MARTNIKLSFDLKGPEGNVFFMIAKVSEALLKEGYIEESTELKSRVLKSSSYDEAKQIISEYVEVTYYNE